MIRLSLIVGILVTIVIATSIGTAVAEKPIVINGEIIVNIDAASNSGGTWIHLRNDTDKSMSIFLHAGNFFNESIKRNVSANVHFQTIQIEKTDPFVEAELDPNRSLFVRMEISNFVEAGEAHTFLLNKDDTVATIRAVKFNVPFRVVIDAADPSNPELNFARGTVGQLLLKNEDAMTYPVEWFLVLNNKGTVFGKSKAVLPPLGTMQMEFNPSNKAFTSWFSGFFKDQIEEGRLVMQFASLGKVNNPVPQTKIVPVKVILQYWSQGFQSFVSNTVFLILLLCGGIFSLFLNLWIPNKMQRMDLLRRIKELARITRTISLKIDSSLRVVARVERLRLAEQIRSIMLFNADASIIFDGYKGDIDLLQRRVSLIQQLDAVTGVMENLRAKTANAPAKILDDAGKKLEDATELLKQSAPGEIDFQLAQEIIRSADERLRNITKEDSHLAEQLANWVGKLEVIYDKAQGSIGKIPKCNELRDQLKELFNIFDNPDFKDKSKILPVHYHWLSSSIERLYVLRHYIQAWENADGERRKRMKDLEEKLIQHLRIRTWNALRDARRLRSEVEENIFSDTVKTELSREGISIRTEPIQPLPNQSTRLEIRFNREDLNTCTARQEFNCEWDFGTVGKEVGWKIMHYFRNDRETQFSVRFQGLDGKIVAKEGSNDAMIKSNSVQLQSTGKKQVGERSKIEAIRLAVALLVAVLGLMAGAREQLLKLDVISGMIAVFLIGFGADTVKNLITKPSRTVE